MSDPSDKKSIEQVIAQFVQDDEQGGASPEDLVRQYPEYADELREFFELHQRLTSQSSSTAPVSQAASQSTIALPAGDDHVRSPLSSDLGDFGSSLVNQLPKHFGDYEILEEIDRGGMGVVYRARHLQLGRIVALKLIRSGELASAEEVERFLGEAEAAAALTHPGIVPIYEVGTLHGLVFYTMAYIDGSSLSELVARGGMDPTQAVRIVHKLCDALQYAHQQGVYHRDLKPANVLVNAEGQPVIIDFGLAKLAYRDQSLTTTGQILGTPAYMAPEQASGRNEDIGPAADIYSLGAILYCLCAGQPAFSGPTPFDVLIQVLERRPPAPSKLNKRVDRQLDHVCLRSLEKDPADRYASASELAADLQRLLSDQPIETAQESFMERIYHWWQREPILVAHVLGIGATTIIVAVAYVLRGEQTAHFRYRMLLLFAWLFASLVLQVCVHRVRWRQAAIVSWLTLDVTIFTTLIAFADQPRSMLLIGFPMMVVASSLFFQRRFVILTTALSAVGFVLLGWVFPEDDFVKWDFSAIFVCGLLVISLCMLAMIRRFRGLSRFYDESNF